MKNIISLLLLFSIFPTLIIAQETHQFKDGLVLPASHHYGREALFTDQLAYLLNKGKVKGPQAGETLFSNDKGEKIQWQAISIDNENKFIEKSLTTGYLYLTYNSEKEQKALLHMTNNSMVYVNGEPRVGDVYGSECVYLPVQLKKGLNEFYVRGGRFSSRQGITAKLIFNQSPVFINIEDPTMPIVVAGNDNSNLRGAIIIVNNTNKPLNNLRIKSTLSGKESVTDLPEIQAMTLRKVGFQMNGSGISTKGKQTCELHLLQANNTIDSKQIQIESVNPGEDYSETFISEIDGSTQYYSVSPQLKNGNNPPALILSVHGAGVEAINQARAYSSKEEGVVVCPTNRRPRGFNWEDWGTLDGLEVLKIAKNKFNPDPEKIYLTGHSMGGHGTWFMGATYAAQWAAIAPCAGYPVLATYGSADGAIPQSGRTDLENLLLRASNPSNVLELIRNYNAGGVYIHHGDSDKVVSVDYARMMHQKLSEFSKDISYYEYPGGSHWFGDESVDWKPIFDYFKWHKIPDETKVHQINFTTANPARSSKHYWTNILQQEECLKYSRLDLSRSDDLKSITGTTENIALLSFSMKGLQNGDVLSVRLDNQQTINHSVQSTENFLYLRKVNGLWQVSDSGSSKDKGTVRNGTFKEPFNHRMVYVYGTNGTKEENEWAYNKARFDAECWYYRGNGSIDIVSDKSFKPGDYPDRGIIIYGNSSTNKVWKTLLKDCPIQVSKKGISVGSQQYSGDNLSAYFMWPRSDSEFAGIAVIAGTGIEGMRAVDANQYFAGGSGFPDYFIFSSELLSKGADEIITAGFYDNQWKIK